MMSLRSGLFLGVILSACGGGAGGGTDAPPGNFAGSCHSLDPSDGTLTCMDYTGSWFTPQYIEDICTAGGAATYSPDLCPTANRVGSCIVLGGTETEWILRVFPNTTAQQGIDLCNSANPPGEWIPG